MSEAPRNTDPDELIIEIKPGDGVEEVLAGLKRQGIGDLGQFVDRSLEFIKKKENEAQGDDDAAWVREAFVSSQFIYVNVHQE